MDEAGLPGCSLARDVLMTNTTFTSLRLSGNNIGDEGCRIIGDVLKNNKTLTALDIGSYN